jgi:hypothetical protein
MQQVTAHGDWNRRELAEHLDVGRHDTDLLVSFAQCGLLDRFIWMIETAAGKRYLACVMA